MMNLGNATEASVPKLTLVSPPKAGGAIATRTFIPHRCHKVIGVLGTVSVATDGLTPGAIGSEVAANKGGMPVCFTLEHPTGSFTVVAHFEDATIRRTEVLRTARKLMDGVVFTRS